MGSYAEVWELLDQMLTWESSRKSLHVDSICLVYFLPIILKGI